MTVDEILSDDVFSVVDNELTEEEQLEEEDVTIDESDDVIDDLVLFKSEGQEGDVLSVVDGEEEEQEDDCGTRRRFERNDVIVEEIMENDDVVVVEDVVIIDLRNDHVNNNNDEDIIVQSEPSVFNQMFNDIIDESSSAATKHVTSVPLMKESRREECGSSVVDNDEMCRTQQQELQEDTPVIDNSVLSSLLEHNKQVIGMGYEQREDDVNNYRLTDESLMVRNSGYV